MINTHLYCVMGHILKCVQVDHDFKSHKEHDLA